MNLLTRFRFLLSVVIGFFLLPLFQMAVFAQDYSPHLVVNTGFLNIRNGPGANHDIMANVPGGTKLPVLAMASDRLWYQVESDVGVGWVNSYYTIGRGNFSDVPVISNEPPPITGPHLVVNTGNLNIRSGPGAWYSVIATVAGGTKLPVVGIADNELWYQVTSDGVAGWVNSHYTVGRGDFSVFSPPKQETPSGTHLVVNTGNLNIRSGPSILHRIITTVAGGTELPVVGIASDRLWYQVESAAGVGWVNSYYTVGRGNFADIPVTDNAAEAPAIAPARVIVNTAYLNIRTGPSASNDIVTTLSGGVELTVLGVAKDGVWYLVEGDFGQGWLNNSYVIFRGDYSSVLVIE